MRLTAPALDERDFEQLVKMARKKITDACPTWTDHSPHDPGMVLVEVFAYLTQQLIARFNQLPEQAYIAFLELMGVKRAAPVAARATLRFHLARPATQTVDIPEGTRVAVAQATGGGEPLVFVTSEASAIAVGADAVEVVAHQCDWVDEELGVSSGMPGQVFTVSKVPVVAPLPGDIELVVGVESDETRDDDDPAREHRGRRYEIWREVEDFSASESDDAVYRVDRVVGRITFSPSAQRLDEKGNLAASPEAITRIPGEGRRIHVWYRCGGGAAGNVAAGAICELRTQLSAGLKVENPDAAAGGRDVESFENVLARGPLAIHSLRRALTARDYEMWAVRSSGAVNRALAMTQAERWRHAQPGTVDLVLVPSLPDLEAAGGVVSIEALEAQTDTAETDKGRLLDSLEERMPLGTRCEVHWAHYKRVRVHAKVVAHRAENVEALRERVAARLERTINPLDRGAESEGWPFGVAIRASHIYGILLAEPGVLWVEPVRLEVDQVPDRGVESVVRDFHQSNTWYVASESGVFRTENGGDGWEHLLSQKDGTRSRVFTGEELPGYLAVVESAEEGGSTLRVSRNCGESFEYVWRTQWQVHDAALLRRDDGSAHLLVGGQEGLHGVAIATGATLEPIPITAEETPYEIRAVAATRDRQSRINVAISIDGGGVFLSISGGARESFRRLSGLEGTDVWVLEFARTGNLDHLWAGSRDFARSGRKGCSRWRLLGDEDPPDGWVWIDQGWDDAGSCTGIAVSDQGVFAATAKNGVLSLEQRGDEVHWKSPSLDSGFGRDEIGRFAAVHSLAMDPHGETGRLLLGDDRGVLRSIDVGGHYERCSERAFSDRVTLPPGWLPCSNDHQIEVVHEHEAPND